MERRRRASSISGASTFEIKDSALLTSLSRSLRTRYDEWRGSFMCEKAACSSDASVLGRSWAFRGCLDRGQRAMHFSQRSASGIGSSLTEQGRPSTLPEGDQFLHQRLRPCLRSCADALPVCRKLDSWSGWMNRIAVLKNADKPRLVISFAESSIVRNAARPGMIPFKLWVAWQVALATKKR
jgi:hypothetical protein